GRGSSVRCPCSPLARPVAGAAVAVDAADRAAVPGAAADDVVHELAVAAQAVVLQDAAVSGLDADRLLEDELRARLVGVRGLEGGARRVGVTGDAGGDG